MNMAGNIVGMIIGILLLLLGLVAPLVLSVMSLLFMVQKKKCLVFEVLAFAVGFLDLSLFSVFFVNASPYQDAIDVYNADFKLHEPLCREHIATLFVFLGIALLCYFILKYGESALSPLVSAFCMAGLLIGYILNALILVQLLSGVGIHEIETVIPERPTYPVDETISILILCVVPVHFLLLAGQLILELARGKRNSFAKVEYRNPVLRKCNSLLQSTARWKAGALIAMIPVFVIVMIVLVLCGQKPDSMIQAFTQTSDWILSAQISPPAVGYDGHYLCTVSLRGHRKLVKPIRYGIRHGWEKIVVNRQLMVANAFEDLLMEKTPRFHRALRHFYDTYGYPLSRHIRTAWAADLVYLLMKPLEWFFVLVLYLFDKKPEDRIASQYLPAGWKNKI